MKYLIAIILTLTIIGCGSFPMPEDKSEGDLNLNIQLGKLNYIDIDKEATQTEDLKIYNLDQKTKNTAKTTIINNIAGVGDTYNITIIIQNAKADVIKDDIASKTINLQSTITMEFLTQDGESNFESNIDFKYTINTANFKWELVDTAYRRALSNAIYKGLSVLGEKL